MPWLFWHKIPAEQADTKSNFEPEEDKYDISHDLHTSGYYETTSKAGKPRTSGFDMTPELHSQLEAYALPTERDDISGISTYRLNYSPLKRVTKDEESTKVAKVSKQQNVPVKPANSSDMLTAQTEYSDPFKTDHNLSNSPSISTSKLSSSQSVGPKSVPSKQISDPFITPTNSTKQSSSNYKLEGMVKATSDRDDSYNYETIKLSQPFDTIYDTENTINPLSEQQFYEVYTKKSRSHWLGSIFTFRKKTSKQDQTLFQDIFTHQDEDRANKIDKAKCKTNDDTNTKEHFSFADEAEVLNNTLTERRVQMNRFNKNNNPYYFIRDAGEEDLLKTDTSSLKVETRRKSRRGSFRYLFRSPSKQSKTNGKQNKEKEFENTSSDKTTEQNIKVQQTSHKEEPKSKNSQGLEQDNYPEMIPPYLANLDSQKNKKHHLFGFHKNHKLEKGDSQSIQRLEKNASSITLCDNKQTQDQTPVEDHPVESKNFEIANEKVMSSNNYNYIEAVRKVTEELNNSQESINEAILKNETCLYNSPSQNLEIPRYHDTLPSYWRLWKKAALEDNGSKRFSKLTRFKVKKIANIAKISDIQVLLNNKDNHFKAVQKGAEFSFYKSYLNPKEINPVLQIADRLYIKVPIAHATDFWIFLSRAILLIDQPCSDRTVAINMFSWRSNMSWTSNTFTIFLNKVKITTRASREIVQSVKGRLPLEFEGIMESTITVEGKQLKS